MTVGPTTLRDTGEKMSDVHQNKPPDGDLLADWENEPRLIIFFVPLPEPLGLPHGSTFYFEREETVDWLQGVRMSPTKDVPPPPQEAEQSGKNSVSLRIWQPKHRFVPSTDSMDAVSRVVRQVLGELESGKETASPKSSQDEALPESYLTVIEAVTPLFKTQGQTTGDAVSSAFDRCIEEIAFLQRAYLLTTSFVKVRPISRQVIDPTVIFAVRDPFTNRWSQPSLFLANEGLGLPFGTSDLDKSQMEKLLVITSRLRQADPFARSLEWMLTARRARELDGDHALAIIAANTAGEILLNSLLLLMGWEEGISRAETVKWFDTGVARRIKTQYAQRLGGRWDPDEQSTVLGKWTLHVAAVRHRIVHAGYRPSEQKARRAIEAGAALDHFVRERLAEKRNQYPRTALLALGVPGLTSRGLYQGKIQKFAETDSAAEPSWLLTYRKWLESA
jgi:hypothetical protein